MSPRKISVLASLSLALVAVCASPSAQGTIINFNATLTGAQEVGPTGSPATGFGTVVLDDSISQITVNESWSSLLGNATATHIHTGAVGVSGPVTFAFTGVPSATSGSIPQQVFSVTAAQITALEAGNMYFNVHSTAFGGGEIRGQVVAAPEPASLSLLGLGAMGLLARRRRSAK